MKKLLLLSAVMSLNACVWDGPNPAFMNMDVPGTPEYKAGWKDGCESGFATYAPAHYKLYYSFYQNYPMLSNRDYNAAWHESFNYCRHYNYKWHTHDIGND
ncbi:MAG: hypothetical protein COV36_03240 [Alphaproteobacteria bacterium CG11_big_fil_rev_8_21_14_0_20_44_7]|nr:MAG: hypothetical protein COV36_03240 [Alphaproteobacteria bacterium CG11_big_fil_rev_8_21_14_0_20_44_7]